MFRVIAHRGFSGKYPENTILSIKKAFELGVDWVEIDVWLTLDHKLVVVHDEKLKRLTGRKHRVTRMTLDQIKNLKLKKGEHPIPLLTEVLELAKKYKSIVNIELKNLWAAKPLADLVKEQRMQKHVIVSSASLPALNVIKKSLPGVKTAYLFFVSNNYRLGYAVTSVAKFFFRLSRYIILMLLKTSLADYAHISYPFATRGFIRMLHKHGYRVNVWTINTGALMKKIVKRRADGIITNNPGKLKQVLKEMNK